MDKLASYSSDSDDEKDNKSPVKKTNTEPSSSTGPVQVDLDAEWESFAKLIAGDNDQSDKAVGSNALNDVPLPVGVPAPILPPNTSTKQSDEGGGNVTTNKDGKTKESLDNKKHERDSAGKHKVRKKSASSESSDSDSQLESEDSEEDSSEEESSEESDSEDEPPKKKSKEHTSRKKKQELSSSEEESDSEEDSSEEEEDSDESEDSSEDDHKKKKTHAKKIKEKLLPKSKSSSCKDIKQQSKSPPHRKRSSSPVRSRRSRSHSRSRKSKSRSPSRSKRSRSRSRSKRSRSRDRRRSSYRDRRKRDRSVDRKHGRSSRHRSHRSRSRDRRRRSRSRSRTRRKRSRSRDRRKRRHPGRRPQPSSGSHSRRHGRDRRRRQSRSRSPLIVKPLPKKPLTYKEALRQKLIEAQKLASEGKLEFDPTGLGNLATNEKPSPLPLMLINPLMSLATGPPGGEKVTPQQALLQTMAAMHQKAQQITGVAVPKYYNPAAVNPLKYAEQIKKRKLLWSKKDSTMNEPEKQSFVPAGVPETPIVPQPPPPVEPPSVQMPGASVSADTSQWKSGTAFIEDKDGKMEAKFRKLMGIKNEEETEHKGDSEETIKKQQELFSQLDREYQFARMTTHTHRGIGLGFNSQMQMFPDSNAK